MQGEDDAAAAVATAWLRGCCLQEADDATTGTPPASDATVRPSAGSRQRMRLATDTPGSSFGSADRFGPGSMYHRSVEKTQRQRKLQSLLDELAMAARALARTDSPAAGGDTVLLGDMEWLEEAVTTGRASEPQSIQGFEAMLSRFGLAWSRSQSTAVLRAIGDSVDTGRHHQRCLSLQQAVAVWRSAERSHILGSTQGHAVSTQAAARTVATEVNMKLASSLRATLVKTAIGEDAGRENRHGQKNGRPGRQAHTTPVHHSPRGPATARPSPRPKRWSGVAASSSTETEAATRQDWSATSSWRRRPGRRGSASDCASDYAGTPDRSRMVSRMVRALGPPPLQAIGQQAQLAPGQTEPVEPLCRSRDEIRRDYTGFVVAVQNQLRGAAYTGRRGLDATILIHRFLRGRADLARPHSAGGPTHREARGASCWLWLAEFYDLVRRFTPGVEDVSSQIITDARRDHVERLFGQLTGGSGGDGGGTPRLSDVDLQAFLDAEDGQVPAKRAVQAIPSAESPDVARDLGQQLLCSMSDESDHHLDVATKIQAAWRGKVSGWE